MHYQLDLQFQFLAKPHVKAFAVAMESISAQGTNRPPPLVWGEETRLGDRLFLQPGLALGYRDRLTWVGHYILYIAITLAIMLALAIAGDFTGSQRVLIH